MTVPNPQVEAKEALSNAVMLVVGNGETRAATETVMFALDAQGYSVIKPWKPDPAEDDRRWFASWEERDSWPDIKVELSVAPWAWRLRPSWYLDDLTWYGHIHWLFFKVTLFSNGGRGGEPPMTEKGGTE